MGLRSLAQVLLGILGFVLIVELFTALDNGMGVVVVGGVGLRPVLLLLILVADVGALVAVGISGRSHEKRWGPDEAPRTAGRSECRVCGWTAWAPTIEQARTQGQQHFREAHGG